MAERLDGTREKIARADEHVNDLEIRVREFLNRKPYAVDSERESETGDKVFRLRVAEQPPLRWAAIAGDAVHNLRSALDHLVWQLVVANNQPPGRNTMFPIADSAAKYESGSGRNIKGVSADAKEILDSLKPYDGGNETLWRLHRLDANDKHQLLAIVGGSHHSIVVDLSLALGQVIKGTPFADVSIPPMPISLQPHDRQFPLEDGDELFRVRKGAFGDPPDDNPQFTFYVAISDREVVEGEPVIPVLRQLSDYTKGVVQAFTPFL